MSKKNKTQINNGLNFKEGNVGPKYKRPGHFMILYWPKKFSNEVDKLKKGKKLGVVSEIIRYRFVTYPKLKNILIKLSNNNNIKSILTENELNLVMELQTREIQ